MTEQRKQAIVIGGGLAGCEAAWQLAQNGVAVTLYEQKPVHYSPAHHRNGLAELVCSNSLKADRLASAAGLLKAEMERMGSLLIPCARKTSGSSWRSTSSGSGCIFRFGNGTNPLPSADYAGNCNH